MISPVQKDGISVLFEEYCKFVGLDGFTVESMLTPFPDPKLLIRLGTNIDVLDIRHPDNGPHELVEKYLRPLIDKVQNSQAVKQALAEMQDKLDRAEKREAEHLELIEKLSKYKDHFDVEYRLRHGKVEE